MRVRIIKFLHLGQFVINSISFIGNEKKDVPADTATTCNQREYERAIENKVRINYLNINMIGNNLGNSTCSFQFLKTILPPLPASPITGFISCLSTPGSDVPHFTITTS